MRRNRHFCCLAVSVLLPFVHHAAAGEGREIKRSPLDHAILYESTISKDDAIRIRDFPTDNAELGTGSKKDKPKYQEIAREMKENAPRLIMQAVIDGLKEEGFDDVATVDGDAMIPDGALIIEGEFTKLNPGSQAKRYWAGFGAGKSQVCATGRVLRDEEVLMEFDHCRNQAIGFFGGESEGQMTKDSHATGSHLAEFMGMWAEGKWAK